MKKIIEFITNLNDGGAENLVKDYCLMLDKDKFDVTVVTIRNIKNTAVYQELKENDIRLVSVYPNWNIFIKLWNKLVGKRYIRYRLKKIISEEKPDCIHAHLYILKYLRLVSDCLNGIKLLYTCHNLPENVFFGKHSEQKQYMEELIQNHGVQMIALHEEMRRELNHIFNVDNTVVIKNGINLGKFISLSESKDEIRAVEEIPNDAFVVGHVGRFSPPKNHSFLLNVFHEIVSQNPKAFLLLVGDGELEDDVRNKIIELNLEDKTLILSHRTDVPRLLKAMDVFLFPSNYEGLGIALVEAQAAGLRCVTSNCVPEEAYLTNKVIPMSLDESPQKWAEVVLDEKIRSNYPNRICEYDMAIEIKRLETLYSEEVETVRN